MHYTFRPDVCRRLPSDSVSRRTPLPLAVTFPLSGRFRDLHPLEYVRAGRTQKKRLKASLLYFFYFLCVKLPGDSDNGGSSASLHSRQPGQKHPDKQMSHQAEFSAVFQRHRRPWLKLFSNLISASIFYRNFYYFCTGYAIVRLRNILMKVFSLYP